MISSLYIERAIFDHPRAQKIRERFKNLPHLIINHYGEIFNRHQGNFRLQKGAPSLILAKKEGQLLHPVPQDFGLGRQENFYFSHLFNCPFDCKYCYLQGSLNSAHFVLFVNYEDMEKELKGEATYFTGYDADSLAFEPISGFMKHFLPHFAANPQAEFEIRTKSLFIRPLLDYPPLPNVIVAYTLSPHQIAEKVECKAPPLKKRLEAIDKLKGWPIGLRFDPILQTADFEACYRAFFAEVFARPMNLHSVTLGTFRLPKKVFAKMIRENPKEPFFAENHEALAKEKVDFCEQEILNYVPKEKIFRCDGY